MAYNEVLRERGLLPEPPPSFTPRTANSRHSLPVFHNPVKDMKQAGPNQALAGGITYIRTDAGFLYLVFISDMWSRKIVGYYAGDTPEAQGAPSALRKTLASLPEGSAPVHDSDRDSRYCCHAYVDELRKHDLKVDMTGALHCYEHTLAERVNGILKQECF